MMNEENIKEYFKLHESLSEINDKVSEMVKTIQDQNGLEVGKITRDGKEIEIKENTMWQEVYLLGLKGHSSADYLRNKYPDVFKTVDESEKLVEDIKMFEMANLGFEFRQMNGANLIKLVKTLIKMENSK